MNDNKQDLIIGLPYKDILEQTTQKGLEKMNSQNTEPNTETHGITIKSMDIQQKSKEKILRIKTGLPKHGTQWARASK